MAEQNTKYKLVTRSDMDGLVCAILLKQLDMISDILFVHPKDVQDGKVALSSEHITTNLPYVPEVYLAFDHHLSETIRVQDQKDNHIIDPNAPSAARVVYDYYGGKKTFPRITDEMMAAVDKADAAQYSPEDILNPSGWELLSYLMDARTGLGRFRNFRISNYNLMMELIDFCQEHPIEEIIELPDVKERVNLYFKYQDDFKDQIKRCSKINDNLVVLDLRNEEIIYPGNRFMIYALFPETNISIHIMWGKGKQNTVFATGKSIINRTSNTNIGALMLEFGGGGHQAAGTCQVSHTAAEETLRTLIERINSDG
jgi:nanoRNase/pAp phosphatase (c-di-AMP/oligoRNAs hydrolase)